MVVLLLPLPFVAIACCHRGREYLLAVGGRWLLAPRRGLRMDG
jgi:hypothetical protein